MGKIERIRIEKKKERAKKREVVDDTLLSNNNTPINEEIRSLLNEMVDRVILQNQIPDQNQNQLLTKEIYQKIDFEDDDFLYQFLNHFLERIFENEERLENLKKKNPSFYHYLIECKNKL